MKSTLAFASVALLTFVSTISFAASQTLSCKNVAASALKFELTLDQNAGTIVFNTASGSETEKAISGREAQLALNDEASVRGYLQYDGGILIDKASKEMRAIEIRVAKTELAKSADIRVLLAPSDSYYSDLGPSSFYQYGMVCQLK